MEQPLDQPYIIAQIAFDEGGVMIQYHDPEADYHSPAVQIMRVVTAQPKLMHASIQKRVDEITYAIAALVDAIEGGDGDIGAQSPPSG